MLTTSPTLAAPAAYRLRPAQKLDSYDEPTEDWAEPDRKRLPVLDVQEVASDETTSTGRPIFLRNERRLLLRGRADLLETDRVEIDGETWTVQGKPLYRSGLASGSFTSADLLRLSA